MLHLSSWTATLPILVIGMVGILLVMGVLVLSHAAEQADPPGLRPDPSHT